LPLKCRKKFLVARSVDNLLVPDIPQIFSWFLDNGFAETKTQISVWFSALESSWWWFDRLLLVGSEWCRACQEAHFVLWKIFFLNFLLHCFSFNLLFLFVSIWIMLRCLSGTKWGTSILYVVCRMHSERYC
jgi:hypothetical protein